MKKSRGCPVPTGNGFEYRFVRFPCCLFYPETILGIAWHLLVHAIGGNLAEKLMMKLHMMGFLYCKNEGGTFIWQWWFWRGSPHARMLKAVKGGMTPRQARLMYGLDPYGGKR